MNIRTRKIKRIGVDEKPLKLAVRGFFMDKRTLWEYFILDVPDIKEDDNEQLAIVDGFEVEIGYIWKSEIDIFNVATDLDILPPRGYEWAT